MQTTFDLSTDPAPDAAAKLLARIRALLAQADSTTYEAEAEAFMMKAEALMERHRIDRAVLFADGLIPADEVVSRTIKVVGAHALRRTGLIHGLARNNGCESVRLEHGSPTAGYHVTVVGYGSDVEWVELLFRRLDLHRAEQLAAARRGAPAPQSAGHSAAFARSFIEGYDRSVKARLDATRKEAHDAAVDEMASAGRPAKSLALALQDKAKRVGTETKRIFPHTTQVRTSWSTGNGRGAGGKAGDSAPLGRHGIGSRRALTA
jgi:hypothetical protein